MELLVKDHQHNCKVCEGSSFEFSLWGRDIFFSDVKEKGDPS